MIGLGLDLVGRSVLGGGARPLPYEQFVATSGRFATDLITPTTSQVQLQTRRPALTGGQPVWYFRLCYTGYGNPQEVTIPASYNIEAAIEIPTAPNPGPVRATFSGSNTFDVQPSTNAVSDKVLASSFGYPNGVPPGTVIYVRDCLLTGGSGSGFIIPILGGSTSGAVASETGAQQFFSPVTASQVMATGNMTQPTGGSTATKYTPMVAIVGAFTKPEVSLLLIGDSQVAWTGDNRNMGVGSVGGGAYVRAAIGVNGRNIPWCNIAVGGDKASVYVTHSALRSFFYKYATHAFCDFGVNDIRAATAAATTIANLRTIWAALKAGGISHVEQSLITPNTTGAWTLADGSDQTVVSGFENAGIRDTLNTSISANVGANGLDAAVSLATATELSGDQTKWRANGTAAAFTSDGLHYSGLGLSGGSPSVTDLLAARYAALVPTRTAWTS